MQIDKETVLLYLGTFTAAMLIFALAFVYLIFLFRNRRSQDQIEENMRLLEWRKLMLGENERFLREISVQFHNKVQQQSMHIKHMWNMAERGEQNGYKVEREEVDGLLDQLCDDTAYLMQTMNMEYLRSQSLVNLIEKELEIATNASDFVYEMKANPTEPDLSEEVKIILYRIVQEAIANISKHATMASFAAVSMLYADNKFTISIEDNGMGIDSEQIFGPETHGFHNMRSRAAMINAKLDIKSEEMNGTKIILQMTV